MGGPMRLCSVPTSTRPSRDTSPDTSYVTECNLPWLLIVLLLLRVNIQEAFTDFQVEPVVPVLVRPMSCPDIVNDMFKQMFTCW